MSWQNILKPTQPIIKAKKTKKAKTSATDKVEGDTVKVINSAGLKNATDSLEKWWTDCKGLSGADIGVTGAGWSGTGNQHSLLDHVLAHVDSSIANLQRPNQGERAGSMETVKKVRDIIKGTKAFKNSELRLINRLIKTLTRLENSSSDPRNIMFTIPETWTKKEIEEHTEVFGHYRTPKYVEYRTKVRGKENEMGAVHSSWYSEDENTAKPPFWQALFAGGKEGAGDLGIEGLLPILIRLEEEMEEQELEKLHIKGQFQRKEIEKLKPFMTVLTTNLKNQSNYHSADVPFKRLTINFAALKRAIGQTEYLLSSEAESDFVKKITGHDDLIGELTSFYIDNISLTLLRTIIKNAFNLDTFKHGKYTGIFLRDAIRDREVRKVLYNREKAKANKDGNAPFWARDEEDEENDKNPNVKKSWGMLIRRGLI